MFEKKRGTRFLASVMALVMLLSLAPVGALAADETPTNKECSAVTQSDVEGGNQQAVVNEDNNTPNPPRTPSPWWIPPKKTPPPSPPRTPTPLRLRSLRVVSMRVTARM